MNEIRFRLLNLRGGEDWISSLFPFPPKKRQIRLYLVKLQEQRKCLFSCYVFILPCACFWGTCAGSSSYWAIHNCPQCIMFFPPQKRPWLQLLYFLCSPPGTKKKLQTGEEKSYQTTLQCSEGSQCGDHSRLAEGIWYRPFLLRLWEKISEK